jgi:signal transduction histidine kinase/ActR/RegA family two-component response regulator
VPFIQLVAAHADRAAHALRLHAELRARSDELARANLELTASMERLAQAQKLEAIGRLAGGIAHDFNNLLTAIMGNAELICTATVPGAGPHDDAVQILETCRRAGEITQQLLAFGRKSQRHSTLVDLNQVAVDLTRMLGRLIGERIQLRLALDPSLDLVLVDRGHVEQVILNLVVNARDAMPEGGDCTIETRPAMREDLLAAGIRDGAGWVSLSVVDEGVGMTDDVRGQVFEPFFTTKPPGQGTGLGLATVHGLVAANGGQIVVHSAPGRGSRFTVLFPVAGTRASADRTVPGVATVLVVDDDEPIRRIVRRVLTNAGYRVLDADGGERALAVAEAEPTIDLLITDVVMPVIGGVELAGRMRGLLPSLPVVFISGYTFERLGEQSLGPADHFLSKPFTPRALVDQVQRVLRERASVSSVS